MNIEQTLQTIKDELEIKNLVGKFSDAANRRDHEAFGNLWTADATWQVLEPFPFHAEGAENIREKFREMLAHFEMFAQMTHAGTVEISGDVAATGRWTVQEMVKGKNGALFQNNVAMYADEMRKVDGKWMFARRVYHYIYFDDRELPGQVFSLPDDL